jgi:hypothetical protein
MVKNYASPVIEAYEEKKSILPGKFSSNVSSRRKHDAWMEITNAISSRNPNVARTLEELKKAKSGERI